MVKTNRSFKGKFMTIEFEIDVGEDPSITSPGDLEECFIRLIGFTSCNIKPETVIQAFVKACEEWNIKFKINYKKAWQALRRDLKKWIKRWQNAPAGTVRKDVLQDMDRIRKSTM